MVAGTEQFSHANSLDQDIIELTDDFTFTRATTRSPSAPTTSSSSSGTSSSATTSAATASTASTCSSRAWPSSTTTASRAPSDPLQAREFSVNQFGFYVGDLWRVKPTLTLTLGARVDMPCFPDTPLANPRVEQLFGYRDRRGARARRCSRRALGFNWDVDRRRQEPAARRRRPLHRPHAVRLAVEPIREHRHRVPAHRRRAQRHQPDPLRARSRTTSRRRSAPRPAPSTNEIDARRPRLQVPVGRCAATSPTTASCGFGGLVGTGGVPVRRHPEGHRLREPQPASAGRHGLRRAADLHARRPGHRRGLPADQHRPRARSWTSTVKLERPFRNGLYASASYLYGDATSVNDGTSSTADSQFGNNPVPATPTTRR